MRNVIDLQLADIKSRALRGERNNERIKRLQKSIHILELYNMRDLFKDIHGLDGLKLCVKEHIGLDVHGTPFDHSLWVYLHFRRSGYLSDKSLAEESMRYVSMWRDTRLAIEEPFRSHGLLPLGILGSAPPGQELREWNRAKVVCPQVQRLLVEDGGDVYTSRGKSKPSQQRKKWSLKYHEANDELIQDVEPGKQVEPMPTRQTSVPNEDFLVSAQTTSMNIATPGTSDRQDQTHRPATNLRVAQALVKPPMLKYVLPEYGRKIAFAAGNESEGGK
ncbi:hypothetical protein H0H81_004099 [Sphagnurus paluster]|uniref:Uncharacterized protein n=1 Tax=Sphagnurus paluster TaxID=117069 RepID=A0A9P7FV09_9AGAR|nr:hypothetical protein H0H81_004099 [Sphagnurus paluster]